MLSKETALSLLWILAILLVACRHGASPQVISADPTDNSPADSSNPPSQPKQDNNNRETSAAFISPNNPLIRYTGRIDFTDPERPKFDWPAVTIEAAFEGSSVAVLLDDGANFYNVTVDGETSVLQTRPDQQRYLLAEDLGRGTHTVRLTKRTETFFGTPAFLGFELDRDHELRPLPPRPDRRIEFVGDSITAGYGTEGESPTCIFSTDTENVELTYAAMTAAELEAEYIVLAISGVGIVRNYNADDSLTPGTMLSYYEGTTTDLDTKPWDFQRWVPQAVVINLGTNDFSTAPHPEGEIFLRGYTDLIIKIRNRYPEAQIFAVAGPIMVDPAAATIRSVVTQMREVLSDDRVHFVEIENNLDLSAVDYGCDWHPNASGQRKIAEQLIPAIAENLGW
ncbi:MAG: SGNH/GDSL hydrolase family protein [Candidatus Promineifilaceae bacterium]|nr:SGNH/GDSL hydrolase family protein [Candidatus Promineifilaceae bacterium]